MKNQSKLTSISALTTCCALSVSAMAQTAVEPLDTVPPPAATSMPLAQEPRGDAVEHTWPNRPMLITGGVLLGGTYAASVVVGASSNRDADKKLYYPVVGPWLDLKNRDCEINVCGNDTFNKALIIGSGALQGAGAVLVVLGLIIPEAREKPWYLIGDEKLNFTPEVGALSTGFTASGKF